MQPSRTCVSSGEECTTWYLTYSDLDLFRPFNFDFFSQIHLRVSNVTGYAMFIACPVTLETWRWTLKKHQSLWAK